MVSGAGSADGADLAGGSDAERALRRRVVSLDLEVDFGPCHVDALGIGLVDDGDAPVSQVDLMTISCCPEGLEGVRERVGGDGQIAGSAVVDLDAGRQI